MEKTINDEVFTGSKNGSSTLNKNNKNCYNSSVAKIIQAIEHAQAKSSKAEKWVDKFAQIYTATMIALALLIAILPPLSLGQAWFKWIY